MTLNDLLTDLISIPKLEDTHLAFLLDGDVFETGYHITELKFAEITGVDCAGRLSNWQEAALQVLDGDGPMEMPSRKFLGILSKSLTAIEGLGQADLFVEFSPKNAGLQRFEIDEIVSDKNRIEIKLRPASAICKPSLAFESRCCSP